MNASSQENANCRWSVTAPAMTPIRPTTISTFGTPRHLDKSSGSGVVELVCELIGYFFNAERICSGTSSMVPNWLSCRARR